MAIPAQATGYGNENAANVFRVSFSQDCSQAAKYEMYDRSAAWPTTGALITTTKKIFAGTTGAPQRPREDNLGSHSQSGRTRSGQECKVSRRELPRSVEKQ